MDKGLYIGVMSGTSLDSVDVALCGIDGESCELLHALEYPMPSSLKKEILTMIEGESTLQTIGEIDHRLGVLFADAVAALLLAYEIDPLRIKAIGLHGQTVWHAPQAQSPFTMQLGDPNIVTTKTGIRVVADFRRKDVALGGQGAPFAPAFHQFIFGNIKPSVCVVNIGGMANITILDDPMIGYDTGCGNVLMDGWIGKHQGVAFDLDGAWAKGGRVDEGLLQAMLSEPYFTQPYPKSTGREKFNLAWLEDKLTRREGAVCSNILPEDVQRTLLELSALSISQAVLKCDKTTLVLCGGGAKNRFLVERIEALLPAVRVEIAPHANDLEAMMFAWLAYKRLRREKVALQSVTGARDNTILGAIYE
jgi:anhydro-N-acetylmuramic acid kinase